MSDDSPQDPITKQREAAVASLDARSGAAGTGAASAGRGKRDLTQGPIVRHLLGMAVFIGVGLIVQTLYFLIDLYFVAHIGDAAVAGVASAGSSTFIVMAASQLVAVGALSLVAQAVGRKDDADAQLVFDQALSLALLMSLGTLALGYTLGVAGVARLAADPATAAMSSAYLAAFLPALALMFPMSAIGAALRAVGVVGPPMMIQSLTVVLNAILAPVLIAGWGTGHPLGATGAGLASSIATSTGAIAFAVLFNRFQGHLRLEGRNLFPRLDIWRRICAIGLPAAGEFATMFILSTTIFWIIRGYGAQAQAGFGIASRILQAIFLPAMAVAFAAAPIAGQNFGARKADRVRATFRHSASISAAIMLSLTMLCQFAPGFLVDPFTEDRAVVAVATEYLQISSWNFVPVGLVFACSGMFQALGDTLPSLISGAARMVLFVAPALVIAGRPDIPLADFWYLSVASIVVQACFSLTLLRRQLRQKLASPAKKVVREQHPGETSSAMQDAGR
jgi:putative MATE family efflux protein